MGGNGGLFGRLCGTKAYLIGWIQMPLRDRLAEMPFHLITPFSDETLSQRKYSIISSAAFD